jgi:hypothetical protein
MDIKSNYYYIREFPRRGGPAPTSNFQNSAEWHKNNGPQKNFMVRYFRSKVYILTNIGPRPLGVAPNDFYSHFASRIMNM